MGCVLADAVVLEGTALWVRECRAMEVVVVFDLRKPLVVEVFGAGALSRDVDTSADVFEAVDATDCGRDVLSLSMDMGLVLAAIFDRPASAAFLVLGALIDVARAMPDFGAVLALARALTCAFAFPINAACALALAASLLSDDGDGEREVSGVSSCSLSSLVTCSGLCSPNIVTGRCLICGCEGAIVGASSSAGDSAVAALERVVAPEMVPGGRSRLRRLEALAFFVRRDGCGSRVGESSMIVYVYQQSLLKSRYDVLQALPQFRCSIFL
jgi:hypothetical protein